MEENYKPRASSAVSSSSSITEYVNEAFVESELELSKVVSVEVTDDFKFVKNPLADKSNDGYSQPINSVLDSENKTQEKSGSFRKMYLASLIVLMFAVCMGYTAAYSATATVDMLEPHSPVYPSEDDITWIGSLVAVGALLGGSAGGYLTNALGRKGTLILNVLPFVSGWLLIVYAESTGVIFAGRIVTGFTTGLVSVATPMYLVEISTPEVRGMLGASFQLFVVIGVLVVSGVGSTLYWYYSAVFGACLCLLSACLMLLVPESPRWLMSRKRREEAKKAIIFLQGKEFDTEAELVAIEEQIQNQPKGSINFSEFKAPTIYKPFILSIALMFFQQFSGVNAVMFYTTQIFKSSGSSMDPSTATILVAIVQVIATLISSLLMDKAGRKPLLLLSGACMALSLFIFGGFDLAKSKDATVVVRFGWLPLICLMSYIAAFSIGFGPTPWLMVAEMTPPRFRSVVSGVATALNWTFAFIVTKTFKSMENTLKGYGVYWFYATICLGSLLVTFMFLPETKGKTESEIQGFFEKPKSNSTKDLEH